MSTTKSFRALPIGRQASGASREIFYGISRLSCRYRSAFARDVEYVRSLASFDSSLRSSLRMTKNRLPSVAANDSVLTNCSTGHCKRVNFAICSSARRLPVIRKPVYRQGRYDFLRMTKERLLTLFPSPPLGCARGRLARGKLAQSRLAQDDNRCRLYMSPPIGIARAI